MKLKERQQREKENEARIWMVIIRKIEHEQSANYMVMGLSMKKSGIPYSLRAFIRLVEIAKRRIRMAGPLSAMLLSLLRTGALTLREINAECSLSEVSMRYVCIGKMLVSVFLRVKKLNRVDWSLVHTERS